MKCSISFFLFISTTFIAQGQKEFKHCTYTYFTGSKKVASSICYDDDKRWGEAKAFNTEGKEIYKRQLRKIAGHASVEFKYYVTGMIKEAYFSDAPDAGIQWYHETVFFDETGNQTNVQKQSHEDILSPHVLLEEPIKKTPTTPIVKKTDTLVSKQCATVYSNEIWINNKTNYTIKVEAAPKKKEANYNSIEIQKGKTGRLTIFGNAYSEQNPEDYFILQANANIKLKSGKTMKRKREITFVRKITTEKNTTWWFEVR